MSNMVVQTNVLALNSHRYMKQVGNAQSKSSARLSSGYKINSAADDAAGLAISEKMRAQIRGLDQASKNAQDGISLIQTAEGGMQEIDNMLQRIRELVVSVSNDTNENNEVGTGDRQKMQDEIDQLVAEIDSMSERVEFNKKKVINGSYADTALQLRNAKAEYDRSSLAKVETNAKLSAYKDALGVSDDTSNATGTTAYSRLNAAQDAVDAGVAPYTAALKDFTAAEVTYKEAQNAYNTTRQTMDDQLSKVNLVAADITNAMLDKTDTTYLGDEFARAFTAYQEASNTWGIEGLGFVTKDASGNTVSSITAANALTKADFTGQINAEDAATAAKGAQAAYDAALTAAEADPIANAYLVADPGLVKLTAYQDATTALDTALKDAGFTNGTTDIASVITTADLAGNAALAKAFADYATAAEAFGVDDLDIESSAMALTEALDADLKPTAGTTAKTGSAAALFDSLTGAADTNKSTTLGLIETYLTANVGGTLGRKEDYEKAMSNLEEAIGALSGTDVAGASAQSNAIDALGALIDSYITAANAYGLDELSGKYNGTTNSIGVAGGSLASVITSLKTGGTYATASSAVVTGTLTATSAAAGVALAYNNVVTNSGTDADTEIAAVKAFNELPANALSKLSAQYTAYTTAQGGAGSIAAYIGTKTNAALNADYVGGNTTLSDYVAAADAWGKDDLDIPSLIDQYTSTAPLAAWVPDVGITPVTGEAAEAYVAVAADPTAEGLIDALATAKKALDAAGEYGKYQIEDEKFKAAEATYNDLVAKRDAAQKTVNTLTSNVESTEKEKTRTDMLYNVANAKLDTAKIAVAADDSQALYFQVGANAMQGLEMSIGSVKSDVLGIGDGNGVTNIDVVKDTGLDTTALLDVLDTALSYVTTERSRLGAAQNRLEYTIKSLDISSENLSAAESRIRDTDMAKEMMELTKANTLQQASISMLAQANQAPQSVLQLLG